MQVGSLGQKDPLEKEEPTPVFLPEESHGQRSLVVYCPWGRKESDMIDRVTTNIDVTGEKSKICGFELSLKCILKLYANNRGFFL